MQHSGPDKRHRDKNGEINCKHGNAQIGALRKIYGSGFAPGFKDDMTFSDALAMMDGASLSQMVKHHEDGSLARRIAIASTAL